MGKLKRRKLTDRKQKYIPVFEGPLEGFAVNYITKNFWRVDSNIFDREDLLQEAHCLFLKMKGMYRKVDNPKWFMALYKVALINYINKLSNTKTERFGVEIFMEEDISDSHVIGIHKTHNEGEMLSLLEKAPPEVRAVLSLFLEAPRELLEKITESWKNQGLRKAEHNRHLGALLGYDSDQVDLIQSVRDYFL